MLVCRTQILVVVAATAMAILFPVPTVMAEDVDLSCMSHEIRTKVQVSERYKEYDVVLTNGCPGPVYWAMCIERLDPATHRILEAHTPTGYIDAEQKIRVNLQMKKGPDSMGFRKRFQEFYVAADYSIDPPARARCIAAGCESARRELRHRIDANLHDWEAAAAALERDLKTECPESGWGKTEQLEQCAAAVRANAQPRLDELAQNDAALREQLLSAGSPGCELYAGELVPQ